jgi:chaperonin GroEL (HSP60 family)
MPVLMLKQDHQQLLEETERVHGRTALRNNVAAAMALADAIRTTLGPKGLDKMLVSDDGDVTVTNDGVTVLETAKVQHPTAVMLISTSSTQDEEVRDGTTSTIILTAELLNNGMELIERGVHPSVVARGYRDSMALVESSLQDMAMESGGDETLLAATQTALAGKVDSGIATKLAQLAVEAAKSICVEQDGVLRSDPMHVKRIGDNGGSGKDSCLVKGLVIPKKRTESRMPEARGAGKLLLLDGALEIRQPAIDANLKITEIGMLDKFLKQESADLAARVQAIIDSGVDLVMVRDGIDEQASRLLALAGISAYRRMERKDLSLLARATGARLTDDACGIDRKSIGSFAALREENWHAVTHLIIEGTASQGVTFVARGTGGERREELLRSFEDALGVAAQLCEDSRVLPGGGATQIALGRMLRRQAATIPGREQLAMQAFAAALDSIPRILATNAGLDGLDELLRISAAQTAASAHGDRIGLDLNTNEITRMDEVGVVEPLSVTRQAISGATDAAISVLRIDDVLWAKQDAQEPDWETED